MIVGLGDELSIYSLMESWPVWQQRIIAYSRLEMKHRPKIKELLKSLDDSPQSETNEGNKRLYNYVYIIHGYHLTFNYRYYCPSTSFGAFDS